MKKIIKERCRNLRKRQTKAETIFWEKVRNRKFYGIKFLRQHPIVFNYGKKNNYFIADFYCNKHKLIIEIDGSIHNIQKEYDKMRTTVLNEMGIKVIRFKNEEITQNIEKTLQTLKSYLIK